MSLGHAPLVPPAVLFALLDPSTETSGTDAVVDGVARSLTQGATGVRAVVRPTADGHLVVASRPTLGGLRRRPIARHRLAELDGRVASLDALLGAVGTSADVMLDVADPTTMGAVASHDAVVALERRAWLVSGDRAALGAARSVATAARLVWSCDLAHLPGGAERAASALRDAGVDALMLPREDWTGGLTTLLHRFGRLAVAGTATHQRMISAALRMGIDAVVSEHPDRLADAAAEVGATDPGAIEPS